MNLALSLLCLALGAGFSLPAFAEDAALPTVAKPEQAVPQSVVGRKRLTLPPPEGFVAISGVNEAWDAVNKSMIAATNRLLVAYGRQADRDAIEKGEEPSLARNFNAQSIRAAENMDVGEGDFAQLAAEMRKEVEGMNPVVQAGINEVVESRAKKLNEKLGTDATMSVSDTMVLGIFSDTTQGLGFSMAMKVKGEADREARRVVACLMTPVNGRVISLYATSDFDGSDDQQWAERNVIKWRDAILAANPRVTGTFGTTQSLGQRILAALKKGAVWGAAIGAVVGLVMWLKSLAGKKKEG